jgi:hypothetical protein
MRASVDPSLLSRVAQRIWAEGISNPLDWTVRTPVGSFATSDRCTWQTADAAWTAELRRSRNRRHLHLTLFHDGAYQGRYDSSGWRAASGRSRVRHLRSPQLALRLVA